MSRSLDLAREPGREGWLTETIQSVGDLPLLKRDLSPNPSPLSFGQPARAAFSLLPQTSHIAAPKRQHLEPSHEMPQSHFTRL